MNTLIAVPCMDSVPAVFCQSLATLKGLGNCKLAFQVGSLIYNSRNKITNQAIKSDADFVLWLDSDMLFEPELLQKMIKTLEDNKLDILTGVYYRRVEPYTPVLFNVLDVMDEKCESSEFDLIPDELFEVGGCGFGCVLMRTQVLFDVVAKFKDAFSPIGRIGEDLSFCWRARECGYKIFADPNIFLGHCAHTVITKDFYEAFLKVQQGEKK